MLWKLFGLNLHGMLKIELVRFISPNRWLSKMVRWACQSGTDVRDYVGIPTRDFCHESLIVGGPCYLEATVSWLEALPWFASPMPFPKLHPCKLGSSQQNDDRIVISSAICIQCSTCDMHMTVPRWDDPFSLLMMTMTMTAFCWLPTLIGFSLFLPGFPVSR